SRSAVIRAIISSAWGTRFRPSYRNAKAMLSAISSAVAGRNRLSFMPRNPSKKPVQEPAHVTGYAVLPVTPAEQPEAPPLFVLDPEIVADRAHLTVALPPFPRDSLRPVGPPHPMPYPPPREGHRWVVGQQSHRVHRLRRVQQPHRSGQVSRPSPWSTSDQRRHPLHRPLRHVTFHRGGTVDLSDPQPVGQAIHQRSDVGFSAIILGQPYRRLGIS